MKSDRCIINIDVFEKNDIITIFDILKNVQYIENKCDNPSFYKIAKIVNKFKKSEKKEYPMETEYQIFSIDNNNFIELGKTYSNQDELNKIFM
jgi:aminoglycoside N3'-acetyltransferase